MASISKEALLKIVADDTDAREKLDAISLQADKLREENPTLKVRVDTAEASAKLAVFREELKAATSAAGGNAGTGFVTSFMQSLPAAGSFLGGTAVAAGIAALLVEITGVVNGLAAAGAGAVAFGALAYPSIKQVETAYTAINTAQTAYNAAVAKQQLDPTKTNATAVATALLNLQVAEKQAGPQTTSIIGQIHDLASGFGQLAAAFKPEVLKVFNDALAVANNLLPTLTIPATNFADALDGILKKLDKFTTSAGFQKFLQQFDNLIGPAATAIGTGLGKIAGSLGHLLTVMSAHDVVHALNIAFDALAGTINLFATWVAGAMKNWDNFSTHMQQIAHTVTANWQAMLNWFKSIPAMFDQLIRNIENYWDDFVSFVMRIVHDVEHAFDGLPSFLRNAGAAAINGLIAGLKSVPVLGTVISIAGEIADHFPHSPAKKGPLSGSGDMTLAGRRITQMLTEGMASGVPQVSAVSSRLAGAIGGGIGGHGGSGGVQVVFSGAGAAQMKQFVALMWPDLKMQVRLAGGGGVNSVQRALGQVS